MSVSGISSKIESYKKEIIESILKVVKDVSRRSASDDCLASMSSKAADFNIDLIFSELCNINVENENTVYTPLQKLQEEIKKILDKKTNEEIGLIRELVEDETKLNAAVNKSKKK